MKMPQGTFNNKISDTQTAYKFTADEIDALHDILKDSAALIETVVGISFNKALATIINK